MIKLNKKGILICQNCGQKIRPEWFIEDDKFIAYKCPVCQALIVDDDEQVIVHNKHFGNRLKHSRNK